MKCDDTYPAEAADRILRILNEKLFVHLEMMGFRGMKPGYEIVLHGWANFMNAVRHKDVFQRAIRMRDGMDAGIFHEISNFIGILDDTEFVHWYVLRLTDQDEKENPKRNARPQQRLM